MKTLKLLFIFSIGLLIFTACNNYGEKLVFDGTEVYYTEEISKDEAEKLGNFLVKEKFADGNKKTVQIDKKDGTYQFRMVTKEEYIDDADFNVVVKEFALMISTDVFDGKPLEIHLCDDRLKTKKVVKM